MQFMSDLPASSEILGIDDHTVKDFEIFESETGDASLFELFNLSRSSGGATVLRRRMENPWSTATRIRTTQASINFIIAHRPLFERMPAGRLAADTETYIREILPAMDSGNLLEFCLAAFQLWSNHDSYYFSIVRGVTATCRLVRALRKFARQTRLASAAGELAPLIEEMQTLLARPKLSQVPNHEVGGWGAWRILRLDQVLRVQEKSTIDRLLVLVYEIDALVSMADATCKHGFAMPQVEEGPLGVRAEGLVHPLLEKAVPNPLRLTQESRVLFLTGPNMAGKTTYLRAFGTALYLAHLGMGVPARSFHFAPVQRLFSSISLTDDLRRGVSYFQAEALRVKAVAESVALGYRVVALMDEPFKGTNIKDAFDASLAILERFSVRENCLFIFSSHHIELNNHLNTAGSQVDCRYFEAVETEDRLHFDYRLRPGISEQRLGMRVLREEGIFKLLDGNATAQGSQSPAASP